MDMQMPDSGSGMGPGGFSGVPGGRPEMTVGGEPRSKKALWVILAVVLVLLLGAATAWFLTKDKKTATTPAQTTSNGKTELTFMVHWLEDQQINGVKDKNGKIISKGIKQYLDEYTAANPNVTFKLVQVQYDDYADRLRVLNDSGSAPDIYQIYAPWGAEYVRAGMLAEPPAEVVKDVQTNYISTSGVTIEGKIWGIPTEINNYALLYNKELFKQAGITDAAGNAKMPKTWSEVLDAAKKLTKRDSKGNITQYGVAFSKDFDWQVVDPFLSLLFSNGGSYLSADLKKAAFNTPEGVAALKAELQLFTDKSTDAVGSFYDFKDNKVGMVVAPPWTKGYFATSYGSNFAATVGVAPMPYMKKPGTLQYSWFAGVTKDSKHQAEAWKFLKWLSSDRQASGTTRYGDLLANTIGAIPARKEDFAGHKDVLGDFFTKVYVDQMKDSTAEPNVLQSSSIKAKLMTEIQNAWDGKKTAEQALADAEKEINEVLGLFY